MRSLKASALALLTTVIVMITLTTPGVVRDIGIALTALGVVSLAYGWLLVRRYKHLIPPKGSDRTS